MNRVLLIGVLFSLTLNCIAQDEIFQDQRDSVAHSTRQYRLSDNYSEIIPVPLDTLIDTFHRYYKTEDISLYFQTLGNYGLPYQPVDFHDRLFDPGAFIYRHLRHFMHHAGNKLYIDTQVPFTELKWTYGGERNLAEQTLGVRHSQNVNRYLNFGLDLNIIYSLGQYNYQKSDDRAFTLHGSYTGKKYKSFASWSMNNLKAYENGGVVDPGQLNEFATRDVPVNLGGLNEAKSGLKNMNFQLVNKYTIGGGQSGADSLSADTAKGVSGTFAHILEYEKGRRLYTDNEPGSGFYDSVYINNNSTYDSLYARIIRNTLRFDFNTSESARFQLGIGVGVLNELNAFGQIMPTHEEEIVADTAGWDRSSNAVTGSLFSRIGTGFEWKANGKLYFTGYRAGDFLIKGSIIKRFSEGQKKSVFTAHGGVFNNRPSWWMNSWGSNHFDWSNDFKNEFRVNIGGDYEYPGIRFNAGLDYSLVTNMLYFNNLALPDQHGGSVSVISARLNKEFRFWKFIFDNNLLIQKSSNENILSLPLITARTAFYFSHEFYFKITDGRLQTQIGFEGVYNTPYYSDAYMPATGVFYKQNEVETGNYPVINVFANIKLKRTRIFVAFDHVNHGLMGYEYFASPYYPLNIRTFKYGLAWTFYN